MKTRKRWAKGPDGKVLRDSLGNPVEMKDAGALQVPVDSGETEQQIRARLKDRFETLGLMTGAAIKGIARALVISGPPGLGKSYDVEQALAKSVAPESYKIMKGFITPRGLYETLFNYKSKNNVIVFDDADSIFKDETSLNLLKAACDTTEKRVIMWAQDSRKEDEGMPNEFEFKGTIVYITNLDFDAMIARGSNLAPHFEALMSRAHYLDMAMHTKRDYMVRIKQVCEKGMLTEHGLSDFQTAELIRFVEDNLTNMRELSLRMMVKLAGLYKMDSKRWDAIARETLMMPKRRFA